LEQLDLRFLDLLVLQHLERAQQGADAVRRLVLVGDLLAPLGGGGDDAGLQLLAPLVERLDALGHRILDRGRGIDGDENGHGGDGRKGGRDHDDVDAEDGGA
jgi:hypothetical protein